MKLVFNERIKHMASWLNALATALIAAGVFAPMVAYLYGLTALTVTVGNLTLSILGCFSIGASLHVGGLVLLRRLRE